MRLRQWFALLTGGLSMLCLRADAALQAPLDGDPQLERKVAVVAEGIPVSDLLARLTIKTGVTLTASRDVADDKVIVFGPARPLRELMADLAALYNDSWMRVDEEKRVRYLLTRTARAKEYEDGLGSDVTRRFTALLDAQVRALDETPEQFARRPKGDAIVKNLSSEVLHGRKATQLYALLSRAQRDALFRDHYLNISLADSTPKQQQLAREAFDEVIATLKDIDARQQQEHPELHIVIDSPESLQKYGIRFNLHNENNSGLSAMVVQVILGRSAYMTMGEFDCDAQWQLPPHGNPYTLRKVSANAVLPRLDVAGKATEGDQPWPDRLRILAASAAVPVLADYYRSPAIVKPVDNAATATADDPTTTLDALARPTGYLWWTRGKTLLFRKRDWFNQRRYEIPDNWLRETIKRLQAQKGIPTYGDVARLLDLTTAQIGGLNNMLNGDGSTSHDEDNLAGLRELLLLAQISHPANMPVFGGEPTRTEAQEIAFPGADRSPPERALLLAFLAIVRQPGSPANLAGFHAHVNCYTPEMLKAVPGALEKDVQLQIQWTIENMDPISGELDRTLMLKLPLRLPDDRSAHTFVALVE